MFEVISLDNLSGRIKVYAVETRGDSTFFLVWNEDRRWHYVQSDKYIPVE